MTEDTTLVARWSINKYEITWVLGDKTYKEKYEYGQTPIFKFNTDKATDDIYYYTFAGWDKEIVKTTTDTIYIANYKKTFREYTIKFINEDGSIISELTYHYGDSPVIPSAPKKEKTAEYTYTFNNWNTSVVAVTGDATYQATYTATKNKYTVTFINESGDVLQSEKVEYGKTPVYKGTTPTKDRTAEYTYTFDTWNNPIVKVTGDATYQATYTSTKNAYLITFVNEDGTVLQSEKVEYGRTPIYQGTTPTKDRTAEYVYIFDTWNTPVVAVTGDATYQATYTSTKNAYLITFVNEDGTVLQNKAVEYGQTPEYTGETPTKDRTAEYTYTFNGWNTQIVKVSGDATYTATYTSTKNAYLITFVNEDGTVLQNKAVEYGKTPVYKGTIPTKDNTAEYTYTFDTWNNPIVKVTGDATYQATYTATKNAYLITFVNEDGTVLQSEKVEYGQTPIYQGTTPTKNRTTEYTYTFDTWNNPIVKVTGDATYKAEYTSTKNKYTVTFINENGEVLQSTQVEYGEIPVYKGSTPTKDNTAEYTYTFDTWNNPIVKVTGDATYKAEYTSTKNKYTVTFINENGEVLQSEKVEYGQTPIYQGTTPTKDRTAEYTYTFATWNTPIVKVTGDATYQATYTATKNKYTVTFVNEDGTVLQSTEVEYGQTPVYVGKTPTKEKTAEYTYTFATWNTPIVKVTGDATYQATYTSTKNAYLITFVNEDGTVLQSEKVEYGQIPVYKGETPLKESSSQYTYTFAGWDKKIIEVTRNETYKASYNSITNKYTVYFRDENGILIDSIKIEYGQKVTRPKDPEKQGYLFDNWYNGEFVYDFDLTITQNITLNTKWIEIINISTSYLIDEAYKTIKNQAATNKFNILKEGNIIKVSIIDDTMTSVDALAGTGVATAAANFLNEDGVKGVTLKLGNEELEITAETLNKEAVDAFFQTIGTSAKDLIGKTIDVTIDLEFNYNSIDTKTFKVEFIKEQSLESLIQEAYNTIKGIASNEKFDIYLNKNQIKVTIYDKTMTSVDALAGTGVATAAANFLNQDGVKGVTLKLGNEELEITAETLSKEAVDAFFQALGTSSADLIGKTIKVVIILENGYVFSDYTDAFILFAEPDIHQVSFNTEGGSHIDSQLVYNNRTANIPEIPTKEGHTFKYWSYNNQPYDFNTLIVGNIELVAIWEKNQYTVTFINENGEVLQSEKVEYGQIPEYKGTTPTKDRTAEYTYTFATWNNPIVKVTGDAIYTATYTSTKNKYTITFVNEDGEVLQSEKVEYGKTPIYTEETPTKDRTIEYTYTFDTWNTPIVKVTGDAIYTATYTATKNAYLITFINENGDVLQSEKVEYGQTPEYKGTTPTKDRTSEYTFEFKEWDKEITTVTGETTYTATYTATKNKYTITFVNEDGDVLQSEKVEYGQTPKYKGTIPTKDRTSEYTYIFATWNNPIVKVTGDAIYTATYTATKNKYTVTFINEDGTVLQSEKVEYGQTPVYKGTTPTKDRTAEYTFEFKEWDREITTVTGETTYKAEYTSTKNKYTITFVNEDGDVLQSEKVEYGQTPKYKGSTPTKDRTAEYTYTFATWNTPIVKVTGEATYQATYTATRNKYLITFVNEDGTVLQSEKVEYGQIPEYKGTTPIKEKTPEYVYIFDTWNTSIVAVTGEATYTATYTATKNAYLITFMNEDGTVLQNKAVEYGQTPEYTGATPIKEKTAEFTYTFNGWNNPIVSVTGDTTYTATYTATKNKYTITFINENGDVLQSEKVEYGETPVYKGTIPTKDRTTEYTYIFDTWNTPVVSVTGEATYQATYTSTRNKYLITFVNENGEVLQSEKVEYGETPVYKGTIPTKDRTAEYTYIFDTWNTPVVSVTGDTTYTATYTSTKNKYTITFVNEDGDVLQSEKVEYGETPVYQGTTPTKDRTTEYTYIFDTWNTPVVSVTGDTTYTATYTSTRNKYLITFVNENGEVLQSEKVEYGQTPVYVGETPTKVSDLVNTYTFNGWNTLVVAVTGETTYKATYTSTPINYTIIFKDESGTIISEATYHYGESVVVPTAPAKEKTAEYTYTFAGWGKEVVDVVGNEIYQATYTETKNKYKITFVNYNGTVLQSTEVEYGELPEYIGETPTKEKTIEYSYKFIGWNTEVVAVTGETTYQATYDLSRNKYTINFINEDGTVLQSTDVEYGQTPVYTGETPAKDRTAEYTYTFATWNTPIVKVTGEATYQATYKSEINKYTIKFINEDGTVLQSTEVEYGQTPEYKGSTPTKDRTAQYTYTFDTWNNPIVAVTGEATYQATYTLITNKYTIKFANYDGTVLQNTELEYGQMPSYNGETPTRVGTSEYNYVFASWDKAISNVTGDITYTATYKKQYTVTFKNYDGTVLSSTTYLEGDTVTQPTTPTKPADNTYTYSFSGWDKEVTNNPINVEYIAQYDNVYIDYVVTFANEDGSTITTKKYHYNDIPTYSGSTPTKAKTAQYTYTFKGWDKPFTAVTGNTTYKATYTATINKYTVTYKNADGTLVDTEVVEYGKTPTYDGAEPEKPSSIGDDRQFFGWVYTNGTEKIKFNFGTDKIKSDLTLTADYRKVMNIDNDVKEQIALADANSSKFAITPDEDANKVTVNFTRNYLFLSIRDDVVYLFHNISTNDSYSKVEIFYDNDPNDKYGQYKTVNLKDPEYDLLSKDDGDWYGDGCNDDISNFLGYLATGKPGTANAMFSNTNALDKKTVYVTFYAAPDYMFENGEDKLVYELYFVK